MNRYVHSILLILIFWLIDEAVIDATEPPQPTYRTCGSGRPLYRHRIFPNLTLYDRRDLIRYDLSKNPDLVFLPVWARQALSHGIGRRVNLPYGPSYVPLGPSLYGNAYYPWNPANAFVPGEEYQFPQSQPREYQHHLSDMVSGFQNSFASYVDQLQPLDELQAASKPTIQDVSPHFEKPKPALEDISSSSPEIILGPVNSPAVVSQKTQSFSELLRKANQSLRQGKYTQAAEDYDNAAALSPQNPLSAMGHALSLIAVGDYPTAALVLRQALALNPAWNEEPISLMIFYEKPDLFDEQVKGLEEWVNRYSVNEDMKFLLFYCHRLQQKKLYGE